MSAHDPRCFRIEHAQSRRDWLMQAGAGFGGLALNYLLAQHASGAEANSKKLVSPLAAKTPLRAPTAKNCIFLFMEGGPSHIDLFDPKPLLNELAGQTLPESFGSVITAMDKAGSPLMASPRKWKQHGKCGTCVSGGRPRAAGRGGGGAGGRAGGAGGIN